MTRGNFVPLFRDLVRAFPRRRPSRRNAQARLEPLEGTIMHISKHVKLVALVGIMAVASTATVAIAEPGSGVMGEPLVGAHLNEVTQINHDRIKLQTKEPTDVRVLKLTFAPGSRSGWHHHSGINMVSVASGQVTFTDNNCVAKTYGPGQPDGSVFVEGDDNPGQATSSTGAVAYVVVVLPTGAANRIEDAPICL